MRSDHVRWVIRTSNTSKTVSAHAQILLFLVHGRLRFVSLCPTCVLYCVFVGLSFYVWTLLFLIITIIVLRIHGFIFVLHWSAWRLFLTSRAYSSVFILQVFTVLQLTRSCPVDFSATFAFTVCINLHNYLLTDLWMILTELCRTWIYNRRESVRLFILINVLCLLVAAKL